MTIFSIEWTKSLDFCNQIKPKFTQNCRISLTRNVYLIFLLVIASFPSGKTLPTRPFQTLIDSNLIILRVQREETFFSLIVLQQGDERVSRSHVRAMVDVGGDHLRDVHRSLRVNLVDHRRRARSARGLCGGGFVLATQGPRHLHRTTGGANFPSRLPATSSKK